ncbi:ATP-binding protein [Limibacter armeniacum]|uniref:sensor histidine kinase n=1 Tax=Limibacter armeniacum TaxID=466084 RepID=UPI002FE639E1
MFFNSRAVAFLLAASTALTTVAFLTLVDDIPMAGYIVGGGIAFSAAFLLTYFTLEFMIFRELNKIYSKVDKLRQKQLYPTNKKLGDDYEVDLFEKDGNPLKRINQEITEFAVKTEQEIDKLKKMEIFRREFMANVSHELKTPIFATQGYILTLLDGAMDDENVREKFLRRAAKSLNQLNHLVEDLLTLSKIESGQIKMEYEYFDLQTLMVDAIEQVEHKASKKEISVMYEPPHDEVIAVHADYNRIMQVMLNLMTNAIKYNDEGGWVKLQLEDDEDSVKVTVRDNGMGIPEEDQRRVFERFYRVEKSRTKKQGGSGLGLAIVKHILSEHNSYITLKSKLGEGSAFSFILEKDNQANESTEF